MLIRIVAIIDLFSNVVLIRFEYLLVSECRIAAIELHGGLVLLNLIGISHLLS